MNKTKKHELVTPIDPFYLILVLKILTTLTCDIFYWFLFSFFLRIAKNNILKCNFIENRVIKI